MSCLHEFLLFSQVLPPLTSNQVCLELIRPGLTSTEVRLVKSNLMRYFMLMVLWEPTKFTRLLPYRWLVIQVHTEKRTVTAFNSTDIRSVQNNVAIPVTALMVTVCISTDALSPVFISPVLSDTNSFHECCWSIMPVTACSYRPQKSVPNIPASFCYIRLIQPWQPNRLFQFDTWTACRRQQSDTAMIWYLYQAWRCNRL